MKITDAGYRPLRRGTKAIVRQASLSGVANRYVDLQLPAADHQQKIPRRRRHRPALDTTTAVDLDQLFNTFDPKMRKALSGVIPRLRRVPYRTHPPGKGEEADRGLGLPEPIAGGVEPAVQGARPRHAAARRFVSSSSQLVADLAERRATSPASSTTRHHDDRDRRPEAGTRRVDRPPARFSAAPTPRSSTCAPRSTTSTRSSTTQSRSPRAAPVPGRAAPLARDARPTGRPLAIVAGPAPRTT